MTQPIILSYVQAELLLAARQQGQSSVEVSPDLGLSTVTVAVTPESILFPSGARLTWPQLEKIKKSQASCFIIEDGRVKTIQVFSEYTNRVCSLLPTKRTPSMLIAGFTMHRVVDIDPMQDTLKK